MLKDAVFFLWLQMWLGRIRIQILKSALLFVDPDPQEIFADTERCYESKQSQDKNISLPFYSVMTLWSKP
jgi:hypothetical protein